MIVVAREALVQGFENSLAHQQSVATANVERLRRVHPDMNPAEMLTHVDRTFLAAVSASGLAAGAVAASGPQLGLAASLADVLAFTEVSVLYVLSIAEVHGVHPEDIERRKLLVMAVMLGDAATGAISKAIGRTGPHWAKQVINGIPMTTINKINAVLGHRFITKYGTKQGVLVLGKQLPRGIGAALGGAGNHLIGRSMIKSARKVFGDVPAEWPNA
jgi:hypothetical protein